MGPYERRSGVMSVEQRGPAVCNVSGHQEGKDEMTKASIEFAGPEAENIRQGEG